MKKKPILIGAGILAVIVIAVIVFFVLRSASTPRTDLIQVSNGPEEVLCAMDTKMCPDGNIVIRDSRSGCDFYECPVDPTNTSNKTTTNTTTP